MRYPAPGSDELSARVVDLLRGRGIGSAVDHARGLDHGAWVPLMLMYPAADIPVAQLSVQSALGPKHHFEIGRAIAGLRDEGVLIVGSGSFTHDLSRAGAHRTVPPDVPAFADWLDDAVVAGRTSDAIEYRELAPYASRNHPTEEHLLPIFVAMGAGGGGPARRIHSGVAHGVIAMNAYAFGDQI